MDAAGQAVRLHCGDAEIRSTELAPEDASLEGVVLTVEPATRRLGITGLDGSGEAERVVELSPLPRIEPCGHRD